MPYFENEGFTCNASIIPVRGPRVDLPPGTFQKFVVDDKARGADRLQLEVENNDLRWFDSPYFVRNNRITVSWGYPSRMSVPRTFKIKTATGFSRLRIDAYGTEIDFHAKQVVKTWRNMTVDQVAVAIARSNGFNNTVVDEVPGVISKLQQSRKTDAEFLRILGDRYGMEWWVDGANVFHFQKRDHSQLPVRTYTWRGLNPGEEIVAEPQLDTSILNKPGSFKVVAFDHKSKSMKEFVADSETTPRVTLGPGTEITSTDMTEDGRTIAGRSGPKPNQAMDLHAWTSVQDMQERARASYRLVQSTQVRMSLWVRGDPYLTAKCLVRLNGFGVLLSGNYYVVQCRHVGNDAGYKTELMMRRDAVGRPKKSIPGAGKKAGGGWSMNDETTPKDENGPPIDQDGRRGWKFIPDIIYKQ